MKIVNLIAWMSAHSKQLVSPHRFGAKRSVTHGSLLPSEWSERKSRYRGRTPNFAQVVVPAVKNQIANISVSSELGGYLT